MMKYRKLDWCFFSLFEPEGELTNKKYLTAAKLVKTSKK